MQCVSVKSATAVLQCAERNLKYAYIFSPIMEILAELDESDIGLTKVRQPVHFDVQACPDKKFQGIMRQIRLKPETFSNDEFNRLLRPAHRRRLLLDGQHVNTPTKNE